MKVKFLKENLIRGFLSASSIIPQKSGTYYLRCLWFHAQNNTLSIMSTDSHVEFFGKYDAEVLEEGIIGVQGRSFVELIKQLPDGPMTLTVQTLENDVKTLILEQGRKKYKLPINDGSWFQELSPFPVENAVVWSGDFFQEILDKILFCINDNDTDGSGCLYMKPVYLPEALPNVDESQGMGISRIEMCGLNGHQFALKAFLHDELHAALPENGILLQKKHLDELKKWLTDEEIELAITEKRFHVRTLDGKEAMSIPRSTHIYHDYAFFLQRLQSDYSVLTLQRDECIAALGRIAIFNVNADKCTYFDLSGTEAILTAQGQEVGSAKENIEITYEGNIERIAFPTRDLMEVMGHFKSTTLNMTLTDADGVCAVQGKDDPEYIVVIMPMRVVDTAYYNEEDV